MLVKAGNEVLLNVDDILCICPPKSVGEGGLDKALDLSGGTKRSVVITKAGRIYLVDARFETLKARVEQAIKDNSFDEA